MKLYGTVYGGFYLPEQLELDADSVVYCAGVGEDVSFDVIIANRYDCSVHMFDPTPRAITHTKLIKESFNTGIKPICDKRFGGGDPNYIDMLFNNKIDSEKLNLHEYGIYTKDTELNFFEPENKEHVSHSLIQKTMSTDFITVPVKTISSIMSELGHNHIDLLKLDIEGVECNVIIQMFKNDIYPKYICVDFDSIRKRLVGDAVIVECIDNLQSNGYKIYRNEKLDVTFIRQ